MTWTDKDLFEAIGQQMLSHWQLQKAQEEFYLQKLVEKDKEIEALKLKLPKLPSE